MDAKKKAKLDKARGKLAAGKTKKKCCRSTPRCITCPTVIHRLKAADINLKKVSDKELAAALKKARTW